MSFLIVNDPPPVYSEKPLKSKSPEHLLAPPRLSSVEEFHEEASTEHRLSMNDEETTTHEVDHTPTTMATTQQAVDNTDGEVTNDTITFSCTVTCEADNPITVETHKLDHTSTTMATSTETHELKHVTTTSPEVDNPITLETHKLDHTSTTIATTQQVDISEATGKPVNVIVSSEVQNPITMTTNQPQETNNTSNTVSLEASSTVDGSVVDLGEIQVQVRVNNDNSV